MDVGFRLDDLDDLDVVGGRTAACRGIFATLPSFSPPPGAPSPSFPSFPFLFPFLFRLLLFFPPSMSVE